MTSLVLVRSPPAHLIWRQISLIARTSRSPVRERGTWLVDDVLDESQRGQTP